MVYVKPVRTTVYSSDTEYFGRGITGQASECYTITHVLYTTGNDKARAVMSEV